MTYTFTNVTATHTIAVTFKIKTYLISTSAGANGSISASPTINHGSNSTITITPNAGYEVDVLTVDAGVVASALTYTFTNVTATHTIAVTFKIKTYLISTSAGANGSITASPTINHGSNSTITITPNAGFEVDVLTVDAGVIASALSYTFTNVTATHTISVTFKIKTYLISTSAGANGSISASPTINHGSNSTITITPNAGYEVDVLTVDAGVVASALTYTFTNVTATHTIAVTFKIKTYLISTSAGANGSITASPTINHGSNSTITITPNANYDIDVLTVDSIVVTSATSYVFTNVIATHTISATFKLKTYLISTSAGANGTITASPTVSHGANATINLVPALGYILDTLTVDSVSVTLALSYTFTNVTAIHTVAVTFKVKSDQKFVFEDAPKDTSNGKTMEKIVVKIVDTTTGLVDINANNTVTLSLRSLDGTIPLSGTTSVAAISGLAIFDSITISGTSFQSGRLVAYEAPTVLSHWNSSSTQYADIWPVTLHGKDYAFFGHYANHGLQILDITNSGAPVALLADNATWEIASEIIAVKVHNNYAYLVNDDNSKTYGIHIYNLNDTNPANWAKVSSIDTSINAPNVRRKQVHNIFLEGNYLYVCNNKVVTASDMGIMVYNISNPASPAFVTLIPCNGRVHDMFVKDNLQGKRVLFTSINDYDGPSPVRERNGGALTIYDITVLTSPATLSLSPTGQSHHSSWFKTINGKDCLALVREPWVTGAYPEAIGDLQIWDVTNLTSPTRMKTITNNDMYFGSDVHTPHNPAYAASEDLLYVAMYQAGAYMFNSKDPANPKLISFYDTLAVKSAWNGCWSVYPFLGRNKVVAVDMTNGVYVLDFSNTKIEAVFSNPFNVGALGAVDDTANTNEDTGVTIDLLTNDTGVGKIISSVSTSVNGAVVNNGNGTITFTPNLNYNGTVILYYTITGSSFGADYGKVTITVNPINDSPMAVTDNSNVAKNIPLIINVMANDFDVDGNTISVSTFTQGANGLVEVNGSSLKYTPNAEYLGSDSFTYTITDSTLTSTATVNISVSLNAVNNSDFFLGGDFNNLSEANLKNLGDDSSEKAKSHYKMMNEGDSKEFTIVLATKPNIDVNLDLSNNNAEVTLSKSTLIFTSDNWDKPQKFTVTCNKNDGLQSSSAIITIAVNAVNSDSMYAKVSAKRLSLFISNLDTPTINIDKNLIELSNTTGKGDFSVTLSHPPSEEISISLNNSNDLEIVLDKQILFFNAENWNVAQKVVLSPIAIYDGLYRSSINLKVSSGNFSADAKNIEVKLSNDLTPRFKISIEASEGGEASLTGEFFKLQGESIQVDFKAKKDYVFKYALVNGKISLTEGSFVFSKITSDNNIKGVFTKSNLESILPENKSLPIEADISLIKLITSTIVTSENSKDLSEKIKALSQLKWDSQNVILLFDLIENLAKEINHETTEDVINNILLAINNLVEAPNSNGSNSLSEITQEKVAESIEAIFHKDTLTDEAYKYGLEAIGKLTLHQNESIDNYY